jgi:hypothetical protein
MITFFRSHQQKLFFAAVIFTILAGITLHRISVKEIHKLSGIREEHSALINAPIAPTAQSAAMAADWLRTHLASQKAAPAYCTDVDAFTTHWKNNFHSNDIDVGTQAITLGTQAKDSIEILHALDQLLSIALSTQVAEIFLLQPQERAVYEFGIYAHPYSVEKLIFELAYEQSTWQIFEMNIEKLQDEFWSVRLKLIAQETYSNS